MSAAKAFGLTDAHRLKRERPNRSRRRVLLARLLKQTNGLLALTPFEQDLCGPHPDLKGARRHAARFREQCEGLILSTAKPQSIRLGQECLTEQSRKSAARGLEFRQCAHRLERGFTLLPIAYITFLLLMNSKTLLGDSRPEGARRIRWNVLMVIATIVATVGAGWASHSKIGWMGPGLIIAFGFAAAITYRGNKANA